MPAFGFWEIHIRSKMGVSRLPIIPMNVSYPCRSGNLCRPEFPDSPQNTSQRIGCFCLTFEYIDAMRTRGIWPAFTIALPWMVPCIGRWPAHISPDLEAPRIVRVENRGLLFTDNDAGVNGTDAGYSIPLGNRTLWLFGDVFLQHPSTPEKPFIGNLSNCALLTARGTGSASLRSFLFLKDSKTGLARQVIPKAAGEDGKVRLWPFGGWYSESEKRIYLYYARVRVTGNGPLDFHTDGLGLAWADARKPEEIEFHRIPTSDGSAMWWESGRETPVFGNAVVSGTRVEDRDYVYVVGSRESGGRKFGALARVPKSRPADLAAYEYFSGTAEAPKWSRTLPDAANIDGLGDFPSELSISYNSCLGGYLAVHSVGIGEKVRLSLAPRPWGPYRYLGEIDARHQPLVKAFCYAGKEHPELAEDGGRIIYITYVDGSRYWLQLLKVTLEKRASDRP